MCYGFEIKKNTSLEYMNLKTCLYMDLFDQPPVKVENEKDEKQEVANMRSTVIKQLSLYSVALF